MGRSTRAAHAPPGWGRGGAAPTEETRARPRSSVRPRGPGGGGTPSPPALTLGAREPEVRHREFGAPAKATPRALIRRGRGGSAPTERTSEGGWVGQSGAQRTLVRDGGVGALRGILASRSKQPPTGDTRSPSELRCALGAFSPGRRRNALTPRPNPRGEGARTPSGVRCAREGHAACADPAGAWGLRPHRKNIRGRVGGAGAARSAGSSGMGRGGAAPTEEGTPSPSGERESRHTSRRLAQSTMRSAVGAACSRGRKWPAG